MMNKVEQDIVNKVVEKINPHPLYNLAFAWERWLKQQIDRTLLIEAFREKQN